VRVVCPCPRPPDAMDHRMGQVPSHLHRHDDDANDCPRFIRPLIHLTVRHFCSGRPTIRHSWASLWKSVVLTCLVSRHHVLRFFLPGCCCGPRVPKGLLDEFPQVVRIVCVLHSTRSDVQTPGFRLSQATFLPLQPPRSSSHPSPSLNVCVSSHPPTVLLSVLTRRPIQSRLIGENRR
jgi:hypothetical protein